jgi:hypothetical protein
MFRAGLLSYAGGLALVALLLITTTVLRQFGVSFSEALYLSVLGLTVTSYGITEWRLRQEKSR